MGCLYQELMASAYKSELGSWEELQQNSMNWSNSPNLPWTKCINRAGELVIRQTLPPTICQFLHTVPNIAGYKLEGEVCIWSAVG